MENRLIQLFHSLQLNILASIAEISSSYSLKNTNPISFGWEKKHRSFMCERLISHLVELINLLILSPYEMRVTT